MEATKLDLTSPHVYRSHGGPGARFSAHKKLFLDLSIIHFRAVLQPQQFRLDMSTQAQPWLEMFVEAYCPGFRFSIVCVEIWRLLLVEIPKRLIWHIKQQD